MNSSTTRIVCSLSLAAAGLLTVGCQTNQYPGYDAIANNPSPEMQSLSERPIDIDRHLAIGFDQNLRMFSEDLGRAFYTDHPSRLSPYPVMYTSGTPR